MVSAGFLDPFGKALFQSKIQRRKFIYRTDMPTIPILQHILLLPELGQGAVSCLKNLIDSGPIRNVIAQENPRRIDSGC